MAMPTKARFDGPIQRVNARGVSLWSSLDLVCSMTIFQMIATASETLPILYWPTLHRSNHYDGQREQGAIVVAMGLPLLAMLDEGRHIQKVEIDYSIPRLERRIILRVQ